MLKNAGIIGVGKKLPSKIVSNDFFADAYRISSKNIEKLTGIKERRFLTPDMNMLDLASEAGQAALDDAGVDPSEIDFVILSTITQEQIYPSTACKVQNRLGIPTTAGAFDMSVGCAGFVYALLNAFQYIQTGSARKILVIGVEDCSRNMIIENTHERKLNILFGDGAGAAVVGEVPEGMGLLSHEFGSDGSGAHYMYEDANHRAYMDGGAIFKFASTQIPKIVKSALAKADMTLDNLDFFVPHQANLRIIEAAVKNLGFSLDKTATNTVQYYGNTSSASVALALADEVESGKIKYGDTIALAGFGSGLAWAAAILKWARK